MYCHIPVITQTVSSWDRLSKGLHCRAGEVTARKTGEVAFPACSAAHRGAPDASRRATGSAQGRWFTAPGGADEVKPVGVSSPSFGTPLSRSPFADATRWKGRKEAWGPRSRRACKPLSVPLRAPCQVISGCGRGPRAARDGARQPMSGRVARQRDDSRDPGAARRGAAWVDSRPAGRYAPAPGLSRAPSVPPTRPVACARRERVRRGCFRGQRGGGGRRGLEGGACRRGVTCVSQPMAGRGAPRPSRLPGVRRVP